MELYRKSLRPSPEQLTQAKLYILEGIAVPPRYIGFLSRPFRRRALELLLELRDREEARTAA